LHHANHKYREGRVRAAPSGRLLLKRHVLESLLEPAPDVKYAARVDGLLFGEALEGERDESVLARVDDAGQLVPQTAAFEG
jgi:hypothetical protein